MRAKSGFTLVEILIVVVILGILAAIVIPQFTDASTEAKTSSLCSDLQTVRSQLELYKIQHNDALPLSFALDADGKETWPSMTQYSDIDGNLNAAKTVVFKYGPYLQKVPTNPFNDDNTIQRDGAAAGDDGGGWEFNTTSGEFYADDNAEHAKL